MIALLSHYGSFTLHEMLSDDAWQLFCNRFEHLCTSSWCKGRIVTNNSAIDTASLYSTCSTLRNAIQKYSLTGRILLLCNTDVEEVYAMLTITCLCHQSVVPINASLSLNYISTIINMFPSEIIIASMRFSDLLESLRLQRTIIYLDGSNVTTHALALPSQESTRAHVPPNEAYILCTSGSTGTPKLVCGSITALAHRLLWQQDVFATSSSDIRLRRAPTGFIDSITEIYSILFGPHALALPASPDMHSILTSLSSKNHITPEISRQ